MATDLVKTNDGAIDVSLPAAADLSSNQYYFVKENGSNQFAICGANDKPAGVLQNKPASGELATVRIQGVSKLIINEAVSFGKYLTPTSSGKAEVCDATGEDYGAMALGTWSAQNDLADVLVIHGEVEASDA